MLSLPTHHHIPPSSWTKKEVTKTWVDKECMVNQPKWFARSTVSKSRTVLNMLNCGVNETSQPTVLVRTGENNTFFTFSCLDKSNEFLNLNRHKCGEDSISRLQLMVGGSHLHRIVEHVPPTWPGYIWLSHLKIHRKKQLFFRHVVGPFPHLEPPALGFFGISSSHPRPERRAFQETGRSLLQS